MGGKSRQRIPHELKYNDTIPEREINQFFGRQKPLLNDKRIKKFELCHSAREVLDGALWTQ